VTGSEAPNEPLTIAVVGYGQVAGFHVRLLAGDGHRLSWLVGRLPDRAAAFADRHGFAHHSVDLCDALNDPRVDAVVLCTPNQLHAAQAVACLEAGKHVLVEIPLAMSYAEGQAIADLARRTGLVAMVGHNHRYLGGMRWVRERVSSGDLTLLSIAARYLLLRRENVGTTGYVRSWTDSLLWHHGQHALDVVLWLFGISEPGTVEVTPAFAGPGAARGRPETASPMDLSIGIRTPGDQLGMVTLSYNSSINLYDYVIMAREDTLVVDGGLLRNRDGVVCDFRSDLLSGSDGARHRQNREFVAAIREGRAADTSAESVLPALDALQRVQDAHDRLGAGG
jgi:2-hydroxy-4-carboxymuconate semialdehyde hemiacetal dehydrogenase